MGYNHIKLSAKSKELCTIVTQWGKYEYQRLPMGLCNIPNIFQENMSELFIGIDTVRVYIDELLHVTKGSWKEHFFYPQRDVQSPPEGWAQGQHQQILLRRTQI